MLSANMIVPELNHELFNIFFSVDVLIQQDWNESIRRLEVGNPGPKNKNPS